MSNNVHLESRLEGSAGAALLRCCCAGESLFMSHFSLVPGQVGHPSSPLQLQYKPAGCPQISCLVPARAATGLSDVCNIAGPEG
jgi:hypothetical protein